jgi:predicted anti-sigma-YlaC factor YlaD
MNASRGELACIEFVEMVTEYLEGSLPALERTRVTRHLGSCDGCTTYLDQMRRTIAMARLLRGPERSPDRERRVIDAARRSRPADGRS